VRGDSKCHAGHFFELRHWDIAQRVILLICEWIRISRHELECEGLSVLGATLWTSLDTKEKQSVAEEGMNDFRLIAVGTQEPDHVAGCYCSRCAELASLRPRLAPSRNYFD
jgi:hypothetical protein